MLTNTIALFIKIFSSLVTYVFVDSRDFTEPELFTGVKMVISSPRIMLTALRGGAGKTTISVGVISALRNRGKKVAPFKKGPDYIDAGWLAKAADSPCYNLDSFLMPIEEILDSFRKASYHSDVAVIEANRGLFDGMDSRGSCSSAELAKALRVPVILIIDTTKMTRTAAAMVKGCQVLDPEVTISGIILNRVANPRHRSILTQAIEECCGVEVLGAVPKIKSQDFPERHMGLVTSLEHGRIRSSISKMEKIVSENVDIDRLFEIACSAQIFYTSRESQIKYLKTAHHSSLKIGVVQDSAFQFYYPENLEALGRNGAQIIPVTALKDRCLPPELDALYIGGGFPETHAQVLSNNESFRKSVRKAIDDGLPVYAECGGLMFLTEAVVWQGSTFPMAGVIPAVALMEERPQGHGYTILEVTSNNPFFPTGLQLKGHEFHYSRLVDLKKEKIDLIFTLKRGTGIGEGRDGIRVRNALATYTHLHARSSPVWADSFLEAASRYHLRKKPHGFLKDIKLTVREMRLNLI